MDFAKKPILVVGATGRHGGTGWTVATQLLSQDIPVTVLTRSRSERVSALEKRGATIAIGDLHERRTLLEAFRGVETAYFAYPVDSGIVDAAANFASAGRDTGLKRLVVMSMGASNKDSPSHLGRAQWLAEELFESYGFSCIHLRILAYFVENISLLHGTDILDEGTIRNSFGEVALPWMSGHDAGTLAVAALLHPERFGDQKAVYPSGGESLSHHDIATLVGRHIGRKITHETISAEAWRERLIALSAVDNRINADMAGHISVLGAAAQKSLPLNDLFEKFTGKKPMPFVDTLQTLDGFERADG
jgi:uncharacterized protein YbjT (DUF2867 family)